MAVGVLLLPSLDGFMEDSFAFKEGSVDGIDLVGHVAKRGGGISGFLFGSPHV